MKEITDIFTNDDLLIFHNKSPFDKWKELMLETTGYLQDIVISEGFRLGFCDKEGRELLK